MFKTNFSEHDKIWGAQTIARALPPNAPLWLRACVVFDCSAKSNGISLNDRHRQGFDNYHVGVLIRFRQDRLPWWWTSSQFFYSSNRWEKPWRHQILVVSRSLPVAATSRLSDVCQYVSNGVTAVSCSLFSAQEWTP